MTRARKTMAVVLGLIAAVAVAYAVVGHRTPAPQPALVSLTPESLAEFRTAFNDAADTVRVVLLLSPT